MSYYLNSKNIKARDNGFLIEKQYYSYEEYKNIERKKQEEQKELLLGKITYNDLKYTKEIVEYLKPVKKVKV
jgi:hypothetical protein